METKFNIFKRNLLDRDCLDRDCIVRIMVQYLQNDSIGTGFFINDGSHLLSCFHVIFGQELRRLRDNLEFKKIDGSTEHIRLEKFIKQNLSKIEIELSNGEKEEAELKKFDEKYDIVLLKIKGSKIYRGLNIDFNAKINYGNEVLFGGFPNAIDYRNDQAPFAVTVGTVSTFVETTVGGEKYPHIQINGVNLPGNSGAPLFLKGKSRVIGIINGNWLTGIDAKFMGIDGKPANLSFAIPLGITYATALETINKNSSIFK